MGEHGSLFCTDRDVPWYGDCCKMLSHCYHICNMDKGVCDRVFDTCAQRACDALDLPSVPDAPEQCNKHLKDLLRHITTNGCEVFLLAQGESCRCMHDEL